MIHQIVVKNPVGFIWRLSRAAREKMWSTRACVSFYHTCWTHTDTSMTHTHTQNIRGRNSSFAMPAYPLPPGIQQGTVTPPSPTLYLQDIMQKTWTAVEGFACVLVCCLCGFVCSYLRGPLDFSLTHKLTETTSTRMPVYLFFSTYFRQNHFLKTPVAVEGFTCVWVRCFGGFVFLIPPGTLGFSPTQVWDNLDTHARTSCCFSSILSVKIIFTNMSCSRGVHVCFGPLFRWCPFFNTSGDPWFQSDTSLRHPRHTWQYKLLFFVHFIGKNHFLKTPVAVEGFTCVWVRFFGGVLFLIPPGTFGFSPTQVWDKLDTHASTTRNSYFTPILSVQMYTYELQSASSRVFWSAVSVVMFFSYFRGPLVSVRHKSETASTHMPVQPVT